MKQLTLEQQRQRYRTIKRIVIKLQRERQARLAELKEKWEHKL